MTAPSADAALAACGWSGAHRVVDATRRFRVTGAALPPGLIVEAWAACDALDAPTRMEIVCLGPDARVDPEPLLGQPVSLLVTDGQGGETARRGLVTGAERDDADGGFARLRLVVDGWLGLLAHGLDSRVWVERGVAEILDDVFSRYRPHARWRITESAVVRLAGSPRHDAAGRRSFTMQYRETDLDFVRRLLADEGLGMRVDAADDAVVVFADSRSDADCPPDGVAAARGGLRLHRGGPVDPATVFELTSVSRLVPDALAAASEDYRAARVLAAVSVSPERRPRDPSMPPSRLAPGAYAFRDAEAARRRLQQALEAIDAGRRRWHGVSAVVGLAAGTAFWLHEPGPTAGRVPPDAGEAGDGERPRPSPGATLLVVRAVHAGFGEWQRDRRAPWSDADPELPLRSPWLTPALVERARVLGYANAFDAIDRDRCWRPHGAACGATTAGGAGADDPTSPRASVPGPLTATVVGADGTGDGSVDFDALGRIRVRFDFQDPREPGSTRLRVVQRWAGAGVGAQFLPRVGQQVLVDFLDGDPDRPVVVAGLYDGRGEGGVAPTPGGAVPPAGRADVFAGGGDHRPSAQGNEVAGGHAPPWHGAAPAPVEHGGHANAAALSGFRSRELGGEGWNQLVFDDSDGAARVQFASSLAGTQMNLGALVHQAGNRRGSARGLGFELRTDAAGALRAAGGVLLTTTGVEPAAPAGRDDGAATVARRAEHDAARAARLAGDHRTAARGAREPAGGDAFAALRAALDGRVDAAGWDRIRPDADGAARERAAAGAPRSPAHAAEPSSAGAAAPVAPPAGPGGPATVPHLASPMLVAHGVAGVAVGADALAEVAASTLTLAAGRDATLGCGGDYRLLAGCGIGVLAGAEPGDRREDAGLALVAAGAADVRADCGGLRVAARDEVTLQSVSSRIDLRAARRIVLAVDGGAGVTLDGDGVRFECPGTITIEAAQRSFGPPG